MLNRRSDAIAAIQQALAIDPNNQRARELLSKL
jgi:cytochrome c-type biogenesis protein CcmH/NrfG